MGVDCLRNGIQNNWRAFPWEDTTDHTLPVFLGARLEAHILARRGDGTKPVLDLEFPRCQQVHGVPSAHDTPNSMSL